jgi:NTE family protein
MNNASDKCSQPFLALALSGGGSRAIAFHLGCLRALHDRGLLEKVQVMSTVSGGSVIGACFAYWALDFPEFDRRMVHLLRKGLNRSIFQSVVFSQETPKILATLVCTAIPTLVIGAARFTFRLMRLATRLPTKPIEDWLAFLSLSLPIWGSLTTAFENALHRDLFGDASIGDLQQRDLEVVVNACELRTGTAFRFGSRTSGGWRFGRIADNVIPVAKAVAASAAFPLLLPPLVQKFRFESTGATTTQKVVLTDGGVFDNLGTIVLEPGRDADISVNSFPATHIISLNAGAGQFTGETSPFWWLGRVKQSFETVHREVQDAAYARLHRYVVSGQLKGFGMVYLGQIDARLPHRPADLVPREAVRDYPTNFSPMAQSDLHMLSLRGEQLTNIIIERYLSDI